MRVATVGRVAAVSLWLLLVLVRGAAAQSASVRGRIVDEQAQPVPGVAVTISNPVTGFSRTDVTDIEGGYQIAGLPAGSYDLKASLAGFTSIEQREMIVDVGSIARIDLILRVATLNESVKVVAASPLIQTGSPVVGGVVNPRRIQELPLNGRQFANLAATLPGVGIAFHRDPTKGTQYSPQVAGGAGRNVNYQVDGGDNNDDTVGGQLQLFPLDAIDEFRFSLASYDAQHGRSSGGVMDVVTKSGTNTLSGSALAFLRDDTLNALSTTEARAGVSKPDYRRGQYGGSLGGSIVKDKAHFFGAFERVQQDTFQAVDTRTLFPALNGVFPVEYRENLVTAKATVTPSGRDRAWLRYGGNTTSQPAGVTPTVPPEAWGDNRNRFHSVNASYARVLGGAAFNELTLQYATFLNTITSNTTGSTETFPNGVIVGQSIQAPQATEQRKFHLRDDTSWHLAGGGGLGHDFKAGVSFAYEPTLGSPAATVPPGFFIYTHATNDRQGPLTAVRGNTRTTPISYPELEIPMTQSGVYLQDDWRVTERLTVNAGVRYDVAIGYQIDQSKNPNFQVLQHAARVGRFANVVGMEDFGQTPREDYDNVQPRLGVAFDIRGDGRDVLRGGWGVYTDAAYTNGNVLFAAYDAQGPVPSAEFVANDPNGLRNPDGTFYQVGQPIANIAALNEGGLSGLIGEVISPRLEQPYTRQASLGWSHQIGAATAFSADLIHADGRNLNVRARLNSRPNGGPRRFADLALDPNGANFRMVISPARSRYDALLLSLRRRSAAGIDFALGYAWSKARSELGQAVDESGLGPNTIQDVVQPLAAVEYGPAASDARHLVSMSAIVPLGWKTQFAPIAYYRSALPVGIIEGLDRNGDFANNDIPDRAFAFDGLAQSPRDIGACLTINCGRGARLSLVNLRVSRRFGLRGASRLDVIAEGFNLFNAVNPSGFNTRRMLGTVQAPVPNPDFMQPVSFAGDFQQSSQRVGQIALRWAF